MNKKSIFIMILLSFVIAIFYLKTYFNKEIIYENIKQIEVAFEIKSDDLSNKYKNNEITTKYEGKIGEIKGQVIHVNKSNTNSYIALSGDVICFFSSNQEIEKIENIKKGDNISIIGQLKGKELNIEVYDCFLYKKNIELSLKTVLYFFYINSYIYFLYSIF